MEETQKLDPTEMTHIFDMTVAFEKRLMPCEVYFARLSDGSTFTRVVAWPGDLKRERYIDVDRWEEGWIDMYTGEASHWSELVGGALDYHIRKYNH